MRVINVCFFVDLGFFVFWQYFLDCGEGLVIKEFVIIIVNIRVIYVKRLGYRENICCFIIEEVEVLGFFRGIFISQFS